MKFVAVTACPTGIAHSQMAAENLEQTAAEQGHDIDVEIQGAMGAENELSAADIEAADAAIIAADTSVSRDRFEDADVPVVKGTVKDAVNDVEGLLAEAVETAGGDAEVDTSETSKADDTTAADDSESQRRRGGDRSKSLANRLKRLFT
ncbi:fructose PTS transporter subunit IIB [Halomicroarcula sp. F13]|uniref:Fructose PTS transporter subunit IIB n=1 Tax=Haloarcula rubra TaxID=2487747 RepID=A0AAW4PY86_9EURY|nr:PTS fructose transporter subunit IIB [Halomicroarcula rubra]MBX0325470.1 fructose PTS transporter subunit IIB [Halomicroarcula rubra]